MRSGLILSLLLLVACSGASTGVQPGADNPTQAPPAAPTAPVAEVTAATIGDQSITVSEIDATIVGALEVARREHRQRLYELRREALGSIVESRLLDAEGKRRGLDQGALLKAEVDEKTPEPEEATVRAVYAKYKDSMEEQVSYETVKEEIQTYLRSEGQKTRYQAFVAELRAKAVVRLVLEPERVEVPPGGAGAWGAAEGAPITVVVFADYECPYCVRAAHSMEAVLERYGDKVRFVFRDYPLDFHKGARPAAVAARCAGQQGLYREMHDALFAVEGELNDETIAAAAQKVKLDRAKYAKCQADPAMAQAVDTDMKAGEAIGVEGTPAFFVNGIPLSGAQPPEAFAEIIEAELARLETKP